MEIGSISHDSRLMYATVTLFRLVSSKWIYLNVWFDIRQWQKQSNGPQTWKSTFKLNEKYLTWRDKQINKQSRERKTSE